MKKLLLILLALLIGAALYLYVDPTSREQAREQWQNLFASPQSPTLYRWQDAQGQWQVSDQPPPPGTDYETQRYNPEANVIPSENLTGQKKSEH